MVAAVVDDSVAVVFTASEEELEPAAAEEPEAEVPVPGTRVGPPVVWRKVVEVVADEAEVVGGSVAVTGLVSTGVVVTGLVSTGVAVVMGLAVVVSTGFAVVVAVVGDVVAVSTGFAAVVVAVAA